MRWIVMLSGRPGDIERLVAESVDGLSAVESDPAQLVLELDDLEGDSTAGDAPHVAKSAIDAAVRHINGFGKLRWGRTFEGVAVSAIQTIDEAGRPGRRLFVDPVFEHMLPEDFADMIERLGHPRPPLPIGLDIINALDGAAVATLAETNPDVGRALHLVTLMLEGDDEIDWVAGYSAVEVVEHDLRKRGLRGVDQGWWTGGEQDRFAATANSVEVLGFRARHGRPFGLTEARMADKGASWFVRRVVARWITYLLTLDPARDTAQAPTSDET